MGSHDSMQVARRYRLMAGSALVVFALIGATPALAQSEETATPADETQAGLEETRQATAAESQVAIDSQAAGSQEIVVTAQKRTEALQDVPISISYVSAEELQERNVQEVLELPQAVPALRINYAGTFVLPTIRGVGSIVALPGLVQNIATYVDGFYVPTPSASNFNLVNVESVNVLKGPQGTLFGANATGGAIQITTLRPRQTPSVLARVGYGSFNRVFGDFYGTAGVTEGVAVDLGASYERGDGQWTNLVNNDDKVGEFNRWNVRSKLLLAPSDNVEFILGYEHIQTDDPSTQMVVPRHGITLGITQPGTIITFGDPRRVALNAPGYARRNSDAFQLTSRFDIGFATLTSYTQFREDDIDQALDYDATSAPINFSNWSVRDETFTQEINLASNGGGRLNWVIGGFFLHYTDEYDFNVNSADIFTSSNKTKSYAIFGDATYEVVNNLFLTGGIRYTHDNPAVAFNLQAANFQDAGETTFDDVSVRAVARYELTPNSNVYTPFTQGYRSGGLPASAFSLVPVQPETINAYEVGYKIGGGPLRLSAAAFRYDYRDIQVTSYGAGGQSQTVNAAKAEIYGLEGELSYSVDPNLSFDLSAIWTHAKYKDFPNALGRVQDRDPLSPTFGAITPINVDATGFRVERTPRFAGSAAVSYGFDLGGGRMALNTNLFYTGAYFFDPAHQLRQDDYVLLNARATWTDPSDHFDISVFGTNLTNAEYLVSNFADPFAFRARYGDPRMFGASLTVRY